MFCVPSTDEQVGATLDQEVRQPTSFSYTQ